MNLNDYNHTTHHNMNIIQFKISRSYSMKISLKSKGNQTLGEMGDWKCPLPPLISSS